MDANRGIIVVSCPPNNANLGGLMPSFLPPSKIGLIDSIISVHKGDMAYLANSGNFGKRPFNFE